jgi:hypothetical protein
MAVTQQTPPRPDYSNYVAHFTKGRRPYCETSGKKHPRDERIPDAPYDRLLSILTSGVIYSTPQNWTNKKAVAFTECPWWSLLGHAQRYSPYGVGFHKRVLFATGGGPALYLRQDLHEKQQDFADKRNPNHCGFHPDLYAFVTPFHPDYTDPDPYVRTVDFTHEREWRVPRDFRFALDEVAFVIVDTHEDVARISSDVGEGIALDKFLVMDMYRRIEELWPTHVMPEEDESPEG